MSHSAGREERTIAPTLHKHFTTVTIHTAKCDLCNLRNESTLQRCTTCGWSICESCFRDRQRKSLPSLVAGNLDTADGGSGGDDDGNESGQGRFEGTWRFEGGHVVNAGDAGWNVDRITSANADTDKRIEEKMEKKGERKGGKKGETKGGKKGGKKEDKKEDRKEDKKGTKKKQQSQPKKTTEKTIEESDNEGKNKKSRKKRKVASSFSSSSPQKQRKVVEDEDSEAEVRGTSGRGRKKTESVPAGRRVTGGVGRRLRERGQKDYREDSEEEAEDEEETEEEEIVAKQSTRKMQRNERAKTSVRQHNVKKNKQHAPTESNESVPGSISQTASVNVSAPISIRYTKSAPSKRARDQSTFVASSSSSLSSISASNSSSRRATDDNSRDLAPPPTELSMPPPVSSTVSIGLQPAFAAYSLELWRSIWHDMDHPSPTNSEINDDNAEQGINKLKNHSLSRTISGEGNVRSNQSDDTMENEAMSISQLTPTFPTTNADESAVEEDGGDHYEREDGHGNEEVVNDETEVENDTEEDDADDEVRIADEVDDEEKRFQERNREVAALLLQAAALIG